MTAGECIYGDGSHHEFVYLAFHLGGLIPGEAMKITWEENDIKSGRYFYRNSGNGVSENLGYYASVAFKIGFAPWLEDTKKSYIGISICDGAIWSPMSKAGFADVLNKGNYIPLPTDDLIQLITFLRRQNEGT